MQKQLPKAVIRIIVISFLFVFFIFPFFPNRIRIQNQKSLAQLAQGEVRCCRDSVAPYVIKFLPWYCDFDVALLFKHHTVFQSNICQKSLLLFVVISSTHTFYSADDIFL
jgi:hypothetical protein